MRFAKCIKRLRLELIKANVYMQIGLSALHMAAKQNDVESARLIVGHKYIRIDDKNVNSVATYKYMYINTII